MIFIGIIIILLTIIGSFVINDDNDSKDVFIKNNNSTLKENESIQNSVNTKDTSDTNNQESSQPTVKQKSQESLASGNKSTPDVDSSGITREVANQYGYTYTEEHGGHYIGYNDRWDEENQCYHD